MMIMNAIDGVISDILILKPRIHRESKIRQAVYK